jgi:hypothetical protein
VEDLDRQLQEALRRIARLEAMIENGIQSLSPFEEPPEKKRGKGRPIGISDEDLQVLLATWFGPLRQFNLAHPRNVEG